MIRKAGDCDLEIIFTPYALRIEIVSKSSRFNVGVRVCNGTSDGRCVVILFTYSHVRNTLVPKHITYQIVTYSQLTHHSPSRYARICEQKSTHTYHPILSRNTLIPYLYSDRTHPTITLCMYICGCSFVLYILRSCLLVVGPLTLVFTSHFTSLIITNHFAYIILRICVYISSK